MIFLILLLGLILRVMGLNQSLWLDEGINIMAAKSYSFFGMVTQYAVADFHPPGWFMILWVWGKLFGYSEVAARMPSVIFGVLSIYMLYLIGKKLVSRNLGLLTALLLALNPLHIYYSQEARMYAFAALAALVNMLLLIKIVKGEKVSLIFLILSNLGILLSDYIAYFIFPAQLVFLLLLKQKEILKKWIIAVMIALLLGIWWLPVFLAQLNTGAVASSNLPTWKFVAGAFDIKTIPLTFVKFIIGRISLVNKMLYAALILPVVILFAYLLLRGAGQLSSTSKKLLLSWLIVPPVVATIISFFIPVYNYFRILYVIGAFLLLIAGGILSFKKKLGHGLLIIVILVQLFCSLVYLLNPAYQREDWKGLVSFLKNKNPEIILFESSGTLPPFDYYAVGGLNAKGALGDFPAQDESSVLDLTSLLRDKKQVYLVDYLVEISDPKRLVAKKLIDLGYRETEIKDFHGVGFVYHYEK